MAEIIAAVITLGGSGCFSAIAYLYNRNRKKKIDMNKYLKHRIFDLKHITPINVLYDKVRMDLFQFIQFNILIESVQDVLRDWIINLDRDILHRMISGELENYTIGQEISVIINNIKATQNNHIDSLPTVIQNTITSLLGSFYGELDNVLALINFEHGCERDWLNLVLDLLYLVILNTVNLWRITSNKINGTLNGVKWKDKEMAYSWFDGLTNFCKRFESIWDFYVENNVVKESKITYIITDDNGLTLKVNDKAFTHMTEYTFEDIVGHSCNILQLNLPEEERAKNVPKNAYIHDCMYRKKYFHASLLQATKNSKTLFLFDLYSLPLALITNSGTEYIHVALQVYSKTSNQQINGSFFHLHTTACSILTSCLQDSVLTICKYTKYESLIVENVLNNNSTGLIYKRNICLSNQIPYSMQSIDYLLQSFDITTNYDIRGDLVNSASFQYKYENKLILAECWILSDNNIIISHIALD